MRCAHGWGQPTVSSQAPRAAALRSYHRHQQAQRQLALRSAADRILLRFLPLRVDPVDVELDEPALDVRQLLQLGIHFIAEYEVHVHAAQYLRDRYNIGMEQTNRQDVSVSVADRESERRRRLLTGSARRRAEQTQASASSATTTSPAAEGCTGN